MKTKSILLTLSLCLVAGATCYASPEMGTWKLNESKSKIAPGTAKNITVVYAAAGDSVKLTVDGIDGDGKPTHNEWTGKFDSKDYPVAGDATQHMRSYNKIHDHHFEMTVKKYGKVTMTGNLETSADGKSRTVTITGTDAKGEKFTNTAVYDKQ